MMPVPIFSGDACFVTILKVRLTHRKIRMITPKKNFRPQSREQV
jgi:hypothetical protein